MITVFTICAGGVLNNRERGLTFMFSCYAMNFSLALAHILDAALHTCNCYGVGWDQSST